MAQYRGSNGFYLALGIGGLVATAIAYELWRTGGGDPLIPVLIGCFGASIVFLSVSMLAQRRYEQGKASRLMDGDGLMTRWRVSPSDWARFHQIDEAWATGGGRRLFRPTPNPSPSGVTVFAGHKAIVIDGQWYSLKDFLTTCPAEVAWLPTQPECIEFCIMGGSDTVTLGTLRVPVPEDARAEGRRVFEYWDNLIKAALGDHDQAAFRREWNYDPARGPV